MCVCVCFGLGGGNSLQTHLAIAGGVGVPVGHRPDELGEPRPLEDELCEAGGDDGHGGQRFCRESMWWVLGVVVVVNHRIAAARNRSTSDSEV